MAHRNQAEIVQSAVEGLTFDNETIGSGEAGGADVVSTLSFMAQAGQLAPPWWSRARDAWLSNFWKSSNHLSLVIYNAQSKLAGIPFVIEPVDPSVGKHVAQASFITETLTIGSEMGQGVSAALEKFYEDLLTLDNGAFLEVIGDGAPDGPIAGTPLAVRHLDSQRCTRTSDPVYPVVYEARDGRRYKLHWTRVIFLSQMASSRRAMNGVGFSAVSRSIDVAQTAIDIIRYKQERLGSRPPNQIIVGKGVRAETIMTAIRSAEAEMTDRSYRRYSRSIAIGSDNADIDLDIKNLHHIDPFDERTGITFAMYAIASAFGLDVTEVWPVAGSAPSGDAAKLQNMRARGKLPAQVTEALAFQFNTKFLPPYLRMRFDFKDDEEDQARALIRDIRGRNRERDIGNGTITVRAARQAMLKDGDTSRPLFRQMEWSSGRTESGLPLYALFFSAEEPHRTVLDLGLENPLDPSGAEEEALRSALAQARSRVLQAMAATRSEALLDELQQDWFLLERYEKDVLEPHFNRQRFQEAQEAAQEAPQDGQDGQDEGRQGRELSQDDESEGSGRSSMGQVRRPAMQKERRWWQKFTSFR